MRTQSAPAQRRRRRNAALATGLGVLAIALATGIALLGHFVLTTGGAGRPASTATQFAGPVFPAHLRAAPFSLTDQDGRRVTLAQERGRVVVLSFIDSHPGGVSAVIATEIRGALNELPDNGRSVPVLAVTADPAHDTPASARAFLTREQMTGRMLFLLGRYAKLQPLWRRYAIQPDFDRSGRRYPYGYSAYVMLIDRNGFLRVGVPAAQLVPEDLAHDLKLLLDQRTAN